MAIEEGWALGMRAGTRDAAVDKRRTRNGVGTVAFCIKPFRAARAGMPHTRIILAGERC